MHFRMLHCGNSFVCGATKKGPTRGPCPVSPEWGASEADGGDGCGDPEAKRYDRNGDNAIEQPFELRETCERHDTHLISLNPGGAGTFCYLSNVKITAI